MQTLFLSPQKVRLNSGCPRDSEGRILSNSLTLSLDGQSIELSAPRRALPLSHPQEFIILSDADGNEIGMLREVAALDDESRAALQTVLDCTYVVTRIARVLQVEKETMTGQTKWHVAIELPEEMLDTALADLADDARLPGTVPEVHANGSRITRKEARKEARREAEFHDENRVSTIERVFRISGSEDVQTARYPHIYIVDTDRNRYEILDCEALDLDSRKASERYF